MSEHSLRTRRWLRFRLRTLLGAVTVVSAGLALLVPSARQRRTVGWLREIRAEVVYSKASSPAWLQDVLGIDVTRDVVRVVHRDDPPGARTDRAASLGDDDMPRLATLEALTDLQLHGDKITDASLPHLARLKRLQTLYLYDTQVTGAAASLFCELPELARLGFGEVMIQVSREAHGTSIVVGGPPAEVYRPNARRPSARMTAQSLSFLGHLRGLAPVTRLAISGFSGDDRFLYWNFVLPAREFDYTWALDDLEQLVVEGAELTGTEVRRMVAFPKLLETMKQRWPELRLSDENIVQRAVETMDRDPDAAPILFFVLENHWDPIMRGRAAQALRVVPYIGSDALIKDAVAALTRALDDNSFCIEGIICGVGIYPASVRKYAASTLKFYGPDAAPAVKSLAKLVGETDSPDFDICATAAETLGYIGPAAKDAVPALLNAFLRDEIDPNDTSIKHGELGRRIAAIESVGYIGAELETAIPALVKMLPRKSEGPPAIRALGNIGPPAKEAIPALLAHRDFRESGGALAGFGKAAISNIRDDLHSGDANRQQRGLSAVWYLDPSAAEFLPDLKHALKSEDEAVRYNALGHVSCLGDKKKEAAAEIAKFLTDTNKNTRFRAASTLLEIDPENVIARDFMFKTLDDPDSRWRGTDHLAKLGPRAQAAIPALVRTLESGDWWERTSAAAALWRIDPGSKPAREALLRGMSDNNHELRQATAHCIENMGAAGKPLLGDLRPLLKDKDRAVAYCAARTIIKLDPHDAAAADVLIELLRSYNGSGYGDAPAVLLRHAVPTPKDAVPVLVKCLKHDVNVRGEFPSLTIALSLRTIDPKSQLARTILRRALRHCRQRSYAVHVLSAGPIVPELEPEWTNLVNDPNPRTRSKAAEALAKIKIAKGGRRL